MATSDRRTIPWEIDEHTRVKHDLLRQYIGPWMKILWQAQEARGLATEIVYIDGFAGPGVYLESKQSGTLVPGSPVIVANAANELISAKPGRRLRICAFDTHSETVSRLTEELKKVDHHGQGWKPSSRSFLEGAEEFLREREGNVVGGHSPAFVFVDPFGYTGFPMDVLARLLKLDRIELFITFMLYDIVRFLGKPSERANMVRLFGTEAFEAAASMESPEEKYTFLTTLYKNQLGVCGGTEMITTFRVNTPGQGERARYVLLHASRSMKALKLMKDGMAKNSDQAFRFEAIGIGPGGQLSLFDPPAEEAIAQGIVAFLESQAGRVVLYEEVEDWAYVRLPAIARDVKSALVGLESQGKVEISRKPRQRRNTVTAGATIRARASDVPGVAV